MGNKGSALGTKDYVHLRSTACIFQVPPLSTAEPDCWAGLPCAQALYNGRTQNSQLNHTARAELKCPPREAPVPWFTN